MKLGVFMSSGKTSLADQPKPTVFEAIQKCRASGVKVIMVTSDQSLTAVLIAKKIGIITHKSNIDLKRRDTLRKSLSFTLTPSRSKAGRLSPPSNREKK